MARPSKLAPHQWREIERRMAEGESGSALAKEFGVSPASVSVKFSKVSKNISETAQKLAQAHDALEKLPVAQQYTAISLAEKMRSISNHMAHAAEHGAATARKLHEIARKQADKIDLDDPAASAEHVKAVSVLSRTANEASQIAVSLMSSTMRETVRDATTNAEPEQQQMIQVVFKDGNAAS